MERIPASERTREKLKALMEGRAQATDERSELVRLAARLIIEEALEGEASDTLGRDYYARGAAPGTGYRNGYRTGRLKTAEGAVEFSAPQIADRAEPFRSRLREVVRGRTEMLEELAVEAFARGLSVRDIEALFADESGRSLLSRTAVSEITERLWAEYEAFAGRDLGEFDVLYLFVDGIAERLHLGQPREAVLAAWGIFSDGKKALLHLAPGTKEDTASCKEFFQDMRRRGLPDPLLVVSDGAPGVTGRSRNASRARLASAASPTRCATCRASCRRICGRSSRPVRDRLLPGGLAGARPPAARRDRYLSLPITTSARMNGAGRRNEAVDAASHGAARVDPTGHPCSRTSAFEANCSTRHSRVAHCAGGAHRR
jgi:mutator family transposase